MVLPAQGFNEFGNNGSESPYDYNPWLQQTQNPASAIGENPFTTNPIFDYGATGYGQGENPFGAAINGFSGETLNNNWIQSPGTAIIELINRAGGNGNEFSRFYQNMQAIAPGMADLYNYFGTGGTSAEGAADFVTAYMQSLINPGSSNATQISADETWQLMQQALNPTGSWAAYLETADVQEAMDILSNMFQAGAWGSMGHRTAQTFQRQLQKAYNDFYNSMDATGAGGALQFVDYVKNKGLLDRMMGVF